MPPNRFESEVESFLEGSHGDRTHIKRADHHTVTPLCGTLLNEAQGEALVLPRPVRQASTLLPSMTGARCPVTASERLFDRDGLFRFIRMSICRGVAPRDVAMSSLSRFLSVDTAHSTALSRETVMSA